MKTAEPIEREFRYGMDWFTLAFLILVFAGFAGGLVWFALVNTDNVLLNGFIYLPKAVVNGIAWLSACFLGFQVLRLFGDVYRSLLHHDRIAFTTTAVLLPAGKRRREIAVPYTSVRGVYVKKMENSGSPVAIILSLPGKQFEIELSKLPGPNDHQEILQRLAERVELPRVAPDAPPPAPRAKRPPTPRFVVVGLPAGSGQIKTVLGSFDDPEKARECVKFLQAGGKYHWVEVESPAGSESS